MPPAPPARLPPEPPPGSSLPPLVEPARPPACKGPSPAAPPLGRRGGSRSSLELRSMHETARR
ncbi:MAG: hypothetical protein B6A08_13585 [Sorangiineae bacterium NIC37A_2]|nr:MAG: hypothetical protein B6A08_13585 [Sorangiineae bacterium NIC37A_2]